MYMSYREKLTMEEEMIFSTLSEVIQKGDEELFQKLFKIHFSHRRVMTPHFERLLREAIPLNNARIVELLFSNLPRLRFLRQEQKLCFQAISAGSYNIVHFFLDKAIDAKVYSGGTALHICAAHPSKNSVKTCEVILERGASLHSLNSRNQTPYEVAIENNNIDIVKILFEIGADNQFRNRRLEMYLLAANGGSRNVINYFLEKNLSINETNTDGQTVMHLLCKSTNVTDQEIFELLLDQCALEAKDNKGNTPLFYALENLESLLLEIEVSNSKYYDCRRNFLKLSPSLDKIYWLLNHGADLNEVLRKIPKILHVAVAAGNNQLVQYLLTRDIDVDLRMDADSTPLHHAAFFGNLEAIMILLRHGANINATMMGKLTALHLAGLHDNVESSLALMNSGADIDAIDIWNRTPLHIACENRKNIAITALLLRGANPNVKDIYGMTPHQIAFDESRGRPAPGDYKSMKEVLIRAFFNCNIVFPSRLGNMREQILFHNSRGGTTVGNILKINFFLLEKRAQILAMDKEELSVIEAKKDPLGFQLAQEVILMRGTEICDSVTMYDLATKNFREIARYIEGMAIPDFTNFKYIGYYFLLQKQFYAAEELNLLKWASYELGNCLEVELPNEIMYVIFGFLDKQDVRNVLKATVNYNGASVHHFNEISNEMKELNSIISFISLLC